MGKTVQFRFKTKLPTSNVFRKPRKTNTELTIHELTCPVCMTEYALRTYRRKYPLSIYCRECGNVSRVCRIEVPDFHNPSKKFDQLWLENSWFIPECPDGAYECEKKESRRRCEQCGEIELVPGTLFEVHHVLGCHEGPTELLCKNCHAKATFEQTYLPENIRSRNRDNEGRNWAMWFDIFDRSKRLYPYDPWVAQQRRNLDIIHKLDERADDRARTLERKRIRLGSANPECEICGETDIRVLTDKASGKSNRSTLRAMGLKDASMTLCQNCLAKLPFSQIYWPERFQANFK